MRINDLLNKYFDGDTSCEEERELKRFFREGNVPQELEIYRPLFAFFEKEAETPYAKPRRRLIYALSGIAAGLLLILSIAGINRINQPANFVIIDGHKSADIRLAREQAEAAFQDVSFSREEIFETLFNE